MTTFVLGIQILFLIFSRVLGFFVASPFWNSSILYFRFKNFIIIITSYMLLPMVQSSLKITEPISFSLFWLLVLKNLVLGLLIGFSVFLLFAVFQIVGELWSFQIGFSVSQVLDPSTGEQVAILNQMVSFLALIVFLSMGGHLKLLFLIYDSFSTSPVLDGFLNYSVFIKELIHGISILFLRGLELSLTLMGSIFLATLFVGVLAKAAPQLNVFQFGMPIYILIGFAVLIYLVPNFIVFTGNYINTLLGEVKRWMILSKGA